MEELYDMEKMNKQIEIELKAKGYGKLYAIKKLIELYYEEGNYNEGALLKEDVIDIIYNIVNEVE